MPTRPRFLQAPGRSFFLFGPRGTGKSTWVREVLPTAFYLDLLRPELYRELSARPERLRERVAGQPSGSTVIVDEVQRIPELLSVVHELLEGPNPPRFVLTGSSARKLRRGGVDLLGGRAVQRTLHPFMAAELASFDLGMALRQGLLPLVTDSPTPQDVLDAYASLYLEQEVKVEGLARDSGGFARFLEAISFSHGSLLNLANLSRECEVPRSTAASYVEVLEDLLLSFQLPVFTRRARRAAGAGGEPRHQAHGGSVANEAPPPPNPRRETSVHPKLYLFDAGVFRSLRPRGPLDRVEEIEGAALEGLVAQHLRAWVAYSNTDCQLSFWRTRSGVEVDFVVYGERGFWAIQVQNGTQVRPADLRSLQSFREDYPEAKAILLHRGEERRRIGEIWCLPIEPFLRDLHPARPLSPEV